MEEPKTSVKPRVSKAATLTESGLMIAMMAICSWISIPLPGTGVPINLATFAVILTGLLLGSRRGAAATGVFVLLGAVGIPVFAGFTGGMGILAGPTGGYLVGYVFLAMAAGLASPAGQKRSVVRYLVCAAAGEILLYVLGTLWFIHGHWTGPGNLRHSFYPWRHSKDDTGLDSCPPPCKSDGTLRKNLFTAAEPFLCWQRRRLWQETYMLTVSAAWTCILLRVQPKGSTWSGQTEGDGEMSVTIAKDSKWVVIPGFKILIIPSSADQKNIDFVQRDLNFLYFRCIFSIGY